MRPLKKTSHWFRRASERMKKELDELFLMAAAKQQTVTELELVYREQQAQHHESQTKLRELRRKHEIDQQQLASITQERMQLEQSLDHLFTETQVKHNCDLALIAEPDNRSSFERDTAQQKLDLLTKEREQFGAVNELALKSMKGKKNGSIFFRNRKKICSTLKSSFARPLMKSTKPLCKNLKQRSVT